MSSGRCTNPDCKGFHYGILKEGGVIEKRCTACDYIETFTGFYDRRREQRPFEGADRRKGIPDLPASEGK